MDICPVCPKQTPPGKNGHVRSDNIRTHVKNKHADTIDEAFIDKFGWALKVLAPKLIVKTKNGKLGNGYCLRCFTWILTEGYGQSNIERHCLSHECKEMQKRAPKTKVVGGKMISTDKKMDTTTLYKAFKRAGYEDQVIMNDDCDVDLDKTLQKLKSAAPLPNPSSILERLKKDKRLAVLKIEEREQQRRDAIEDIEEDELDEDDEPDIFDDYDDVIAPLMVELARSAPQKEKLINQNKEMRMELDKKEDELDMMKRMKDEEIADLKRRLNNLSADITEERMQLRQEIRTLKAKLPVDNDQPEEEAQPAEVSDTVTHVAENTFVQWSLPFQG